MTFKIKRYEAKTFLEPFIRNEESIKLERNWFDLTNFYWMAASCVWKRCLYRFCLGFDHKKNFYNPLFVKLFLHRYSCEFFLMFISRAMQALHYRGRTAFYYLYIFMALYEWSTWWNIYFILKYLYTMMLYDISAI